jgi:hypothetical protein
MPTQYQTLTYLDAYHEPHTKGCLADKKDRAFKSEQTTMSYMKILVACNVILFALCGYLIFQNQQLQRPSPQGLLHEVATSKVGVTEVTGAGDSSVFGESTKEEPQQQSKADVAVDIENQARVDVITQESINDEEPVSAEQIAAAAAYTDTYSSTKQKLEALLETGNYRQGS